MSRTIVTNCFPDDVGIKYENIHFSENVILQLFQSLWQWGFRSVFKDILTKVIARRERSGDLVVLFRHRPDANEVQRNDNESVKANQQSHADALVI